MLQVTTPSDESTAAGRWSALAADWPGAAHDVRAVSSTSVLAASGTSGDPWPIASISKLLTTYAILIGVEEGAVALGDEVGPPGSTLRHLLAHASGYGPDDDRVLAEPGTRRIYSNHGMEVAAAHLAASSGMTFDEYLHEAVVAPLRMTTTTLEGSPAHGVRSTADDLVAFCHEVMNPSLIAPATLAEATSAQFGEIPGVLPGYGIQRPNDWGLGFEIRGHKSPHWTGAANHPATFGHFGRSGSLLWIDPVRRLGLVGLGLVDFDRWAVDLWPVLSDATVDLGVR